MNPDKLNIPVITIVGRQGVGKSTLFNRIVKKRRAIVEENGPTTRDRISEIIEYNGRVFEIVDTGGMYFDQKQDFSDLVEKQVITAIKESDCVIMVCDAKTGILPLDQRIADLLRKSGKTPFLAVNKADNQALAQSASEFYALGFGEPIPVSAVHSKGIGDFLDILTKEMVSSRIKDAEVRIKLAITGRPNAGKSTLVNSILGQDRVIVSDEPGTTRDSVDARFDRDGDSFLIVDTAGIRSRGKIKDDTTFFSILRAEKSIKSSDVCVVLLDGTLGVTKEDHRIIGLVQKHSRPFALVINKWDICEEKGYKVKDYESAIRKLLKFIYSAPIIFASAKKGQKINKILDTAKELYGKSRKNYSTDTLNEISKKISIKSTRLYSARQIKDRVPRIEITVKNPSALKRQESSHIENVYRRELGLYGVPLKIVLQKKRFSRKRR